MVLYLRSLGGGNLKSLACERPDVWGVCLKSFGLIGQVPRGAACSWLEGVHYSIKRSENEALLVRDLYRKRNIGSIVVLLTIVEEIADEN